MSQSPFLVHARILLHCSIGAEGGMAYDCLFGLACYFGLLQWLINLVGGQLCDMAYIVPMHVKPKFTYLLTCYFGCQWWVISNLINTTQSLYNLNLNNPNYMHFKNACHFVAMDYWGYFGSVLFCYMVIRPLLRATWIIRTVWGDVPMRCVTSSSVNTPLALWIPPRPIVSSWIMSVGSRSCTGLPTIYYYKVCVCSVPIWMIQ